MQADIKNRNGRVYPMEVLDEEVRKYNAFQDSLAPSSIKSTDVVGIGRSSVGRRGIASAVEYAGLKTREHA